MTIKQHHFIKAFSSMTLRDYFAAKAMQTYMADENLIEAYSHFGKNVKEEVAAIAYMMADAMLEARKL